MNTPKDMTASTPNPFQIQNAPSSVPTPKKKAKGLGWIKWFVIFGVACGLGWWGIQEGPSLWKEVRQQEFFQQLPLVRPSGKPPTVLFQADNDALNQKEARQQYRDALKAFNDKEYSRSLHLFESLEPVYPGLLDLLLFHRAEIYGAQGNEEAVQSTLKQLLWEHAYSPLRGLAQYRLGQSAMRASDPVLAQSTFEQVLAEHPETDYAIGSLYYLGELALAQAVPQEEKAFRWWRTYLEQSPDGRFSLTIARQLEKHLPNFSESDHRLLGRAYALSEQESENVIRHLIHAPFQEAWFLLGSSQIRLGNREEGIQTLMKGMPLAQSPSEAQSAIDVLIRNTSRKKRFHYLKQLSAQELPFGGDYVLWRLAQLDPSQANQYYRKILAHYPDGDYAPESSWHQLWLKLKEGDTAGFLSDGASHVTQYPQAKSSPKVLFWQGKSAERLQKKEDATKYYQKLIRHYAGDYYAFRAQGRLLEIQGIADDPGWQTSHSASYPPSSDRLVVGLIPGKAQLGDYPHAVAKELQAIGAVDDLALVLNEQLGEVPAAILSWQKFQEGNRAEGIRTIRDDYVNRQVQQRREGQAEVVSLSSGEQKLLYPIVFSQPIVKESRKNKLDPYLVQSLMREESYFNELAVSSSKAMGLMQLLPPTAKEVAGWVGLSSFKTLDLFQPLVNVKLGSRYLGYLHDRFKSYPHRSMLAVGAYNGGPNAMARWLKANYSTFQADPDRYVELIPYDQTRDYIKKVYTSYWNYRALYTSESSN